MPTPRILPPWMRSVPPPSMTRPSSTTWMVPALMATTSDGASVWDVREATRAAGEAVTREMERRANTSRVARMVTRALGGGGDGPGPGLCHGPDSDLGLSLACEGCGADGTAGVACSTCGILPRPRVTAGMGLESAMA